MEDWLREAIERAKEEAQEFVDAMYSIADRKNIDREWFIDEVIKNVHKIKDKVE